MHQALLQGYVAVAVWEVEGTAVSIHYYYSKGGVVKKKEHCSPLEKKKNL